MVQPQRGHMELTQFYRRFVFDETFKPALNFTRRHTKRMCKYTRKKCCGRFPIATCRISVPSDVTFSKLVTFKHLQLGMT